MLQIEATDLEFVIYTQLVVSLQLLKRVYQDAEVDQLLFRVGCEHVNSYVVVCMSIIAECDQKTKLAQEIQLA